MKKYAISFMVFLFIVNLLSSFFLYKYCKSMNIPFKIEYLRNSIQSIKKSQENKKSKTYRYLYNTIWFITWILIFTYVIWIMFNLD